jgi:uncharacterized protein (TIGR03437 family)
MQSDVHLVTDSAGNFYAAGTANNHVLVAKIDPNGKILYSKSFGGNGIDRPLAIAVDKVGSSYVVGITNSPDFPLVNANHSTGTMFCAKLSPDGSTIVYSTLLGTGEADAVAVDSSGSAYVTGIASSLGLASTPGAFQTISKGPDAYVLKLGPDGKVVFTTFLGGNGFCNAGPSCFGLAGGITDSDEGRAIAVDPTGNVYVAGVTNAADFPVTPDAFQTTYANPSGVTPNGFVSKLSPDGSTLLYSTYLGTASGEYLNALILNGSGEALVAGNTYSTSFPTTAGAAFPAPHAPGAIVARLNSQGSALLYGTYLGSGNVNGVVADGGGNLSLTGYADLGPFPVTSGALSVGGAYFAQLSADGKSLIYSTLLPSGSAGNAVALGASGTPAVLGGAGVLTIFGSADSAAPAVYALANTAGPYVAGQVAPGEIVSLFGVNLGPDQAVGLALDPSGLVATQLAGVQVRFDGVLAPMIMAQKNQLNIQVPYEIADEGVTAMQITGAAGTSQVYSLQVVPSEPGFLTVDGLYAAAINEDGSINTSNNPVTLGSVITLFVTGSGSWGSGLRTGQVSPLSLAYPVLTVNAYVLLSSAPQTLAETEVLYAGSAPGLTDGVLQVNLRLPGPDVFALAGIANSQIVNLVLQIGDVQSPFATIWTRFQP